MGNRLESGVSRFRERNQYLNMLKHNFIILLSILILDLTALSTPCLPLEPGEVIVIANRNAPESIGLARYYMEKRQIPDKNFIKLWVTDKETCSRYNYEKKIAEPVRR